MHQNAVRHTDGRSGTCLLDSQPNSAERALDYAKETIAAVCRDEVGIEKLVISKGYTKGREDYKNKQIHIELAERMKER